jgi:hypothetical protein
MARCEAFSGVGWRLVEGAWLGVEGLDVPQRPRPG